MMVITADQINSRASDDAVPEGIALISAAWSAELLLPVGRMAGDEIQIVSSSGEAILGSILMLTRDGRWSVGLGIGDARLGATAHESTGSAFISARRSVERAKSRTLRFACESELARAEAAHAEALIDLLLLLRKRRTTLGWELFDSASHGTTQSEAAAALGITPQAASQRANAAALRYESRATSALAAVLRSADSAATGTRPVA